MLHHPITTNVYGTSDIGRVRESNQDMWAAAPEEGLFILADGMGGHSGGEVAAREAVDHFLSLQKEWTHPRNMSPENALVRVREALEETNRFIFLKGRGNEKLKGMGTTLCVLYFLRAHAIIAHIGDSRIYRFRNHVLDQLTEDHSLVAELIGMGAMRSEEAETFPYKHVLTRAVGTHASVEATVNFVSVDPKDVFLICSDGLTNLVSDIDIARILQWEATLQEKGDALVSLANEHGGMDNITVVLIEASSDLSRQ